MCFNEQTRIQSKTEIVNVNSNEPVFYPFNIKTKNAVVVAIISTMPMQNCVFLMLLKT